MANGTPALLPHFGFEFLGVGKILPQSGRVAPGGLGFRRDGSRSSEPYAGVGHDVWRLLDHGPGQLLGIGVASWRVLRDRVLTNSPLKNEPTRSGYSKTAS